MMTRGFTEELSHTARTLAGEALSTALQSVRAHTRQFVATLPEVCFAPPRITAINPPLWECAHVAWFAEWWCVRGAHNTDAGGTVAKLPSVWPQADAMLDSNALAHDARWQLPLLTRASTLTYMDAAHDAVLGTLSQIPADDDAALYPFRLSLLHEAMHLEALAWCAQTLGWTRPAWVRPLRDMHRAGEIAIESTAAQIGHHGEGFSFDNERGGHDVTLAAYSIDHTPVSNAQFQQFVESGEYLARTGRTHPSFWRADGAHWLVRSFAEWLPLNPRAPVIHVSAQDADAYCHWAGRRLPSEFEWEHAAAARLIDWGDSVWEWTATTFAPYAGFSADRYREYSAPWFDGRHRVLRGASYATLELMHHVRYRNYFLPHRSDVFAGFRTVAV